MLIWKKFLLKNHTAYYYHILVLHYYKINIQKNMRIFFII